MKSRESQPESSPDTCRSGSALAAERVDDDQDDQPQHDRDRNPDGSLQPFLADDRVLSFQLPAASFFVLVAIFFAKFKSGFAVRAHRMLAQHFCGRFENVSVRARDRINIDIAETIFFRTVRLTFCGTRDINSGQRIKIVSALARFLVSASGCH